MKKILTASLVAMMAVTAANADIASTKYVDDAKTAAQTFATGLDTAMGLRVTALEGDNTTNKGDIKDLQDTVAELTEGGNGTSVAEQISAAVTGLKVDEVTAGDGKYFGAYKQENGKVSMTEKAFETTITEEGSANAPSVNAVKAYVVSEIGILEGDMSGQLTGVKNDVSGLKTSSATKTELNAVKETAEAALPTATFNEFKTTNAAAITKAQTDAEATAAGALATAKSELQGAIDAVKDGTSLATGAVKTDNIANKAVTETQLSDSVNASLDLADSALQEADKTELEGKITGAQSAAESSAKTYTDNQLKSYTNTEAMTSAIATAKGEAISAAAADATTKADQAEADAISAAASDAAGKYQVKSSKMSIGGANGTWTDLTSTDIGYNGQGTYSLVLKDGNIRWEEVKY